MPVRVSPAGKLPNACEKLPKSSLLHTVSNIEIQPQNAGPAGCSSSSSNCSSHEKPVVKITSDPKSATTATGKSKRSRGKWLKKWTLKKTSKGGKPVKLFYSRVSDNAELGNIPTAEKSTNTIDVDIPDYSMFECNICRNVAKNAVVSSCGHLFCWPCFYLWSEAQPQPQLCPVCKATISNSSVIALFGHDTIKAENQRNDIPQRLPAQRFQPPPVRHNVFAVLWNDSQLVYLLCGLVLNFIDMIASFPFHSSVPPVVRIVIYFGTLGLIWLVLFLLNL